MLAAASTVSCWRNGASAAAPSTCTTARRLTTLGWGTTGWGLLPEHHFGRLDEDGDGIALGEGELFGAAACEAGRRSYVNASLRSVRAGDSYFTTHLTPSRPDIEREQVDHRLTTGRPTSSSPRQQSDSGLSPNCSSWCSPDSRALRERLPLGHDERAGPAPRAAVRRTGGEARRAHARARARARLAPCPSWKGSASPSRAVVARGLLASPLGMREDDCPGDSTLAQASVR